MGSATHAGCSCCTGCGWCCRRPFVRWSTKCHSFCLFIIRILYTTPRRRTFSRLRDRRRQALHASTAMALVRGIVCLVAGFLAAYGVKWFWPLAGWEYAVCVGMVAAYIVQYFDRSSFRPQGRAWPWFQRLSIWKWVVGLMEAQFLLSDPKLIERHGQYIFMCHPHGVITANHMALMTVRSVQAAQCS